MVVFTVDKQLDGISVQNFLRRHCNVSSRLLAKLKRTENGIILNGRLLRSIDILHVGDRVELNFPSDVNNIVPVDLPVEIVYEDNDIIIFNKPPFMLVHPVHEHRFDTLANAAAFHSQSKGESYAFRAVNRLDKDTSGLVLTAKTGYAHTFLAKNTQKVYMALCEGKTEKNGTIDAPIRLKSGHTIQRETGEGGLRAVTHYKALKYKYDHTLLEIKLETGRTHQIRTHFASIGHPLAGDDMYGGSLEYFSRQCLHCANIELIHPITREKLIFFKEPEDWLSVIGEKFS